MTRKISHSSTMTARPARPSSIPARRARGVDVALGIELMSDRKVPGIYKLRAFAMGAAVVVMILAGAVLVTHAAGLNGTGIPALNAAAALFAGSVIFGLLLMPWTAPEREVSRLRWRSYAVIPLKARKPLKQSGHPERFLGGAPAPRYAVIPRRQR